MLPVCHQCGVFVVVSRAAAFWAIGRHGRSLSNCGRSAAGKSKRAVRLRLDGTYRCRDFELIFGGLTLRYLMDTHLQAWAVGEPSKLSKLARKILENPAHERFVSAASVWEMSIKFSKGKWPEVASFMDDQQFQDDLARLHAEELFVCSKHMRLAGHF
jgi:hypothetical protein